MTKKLIEFIDAINLAELCQAIAVREANIGKIDDILARFEEVFNEDKDVDEYFGEIPYSRELLQKVELLYSFYKEGPGIHLYSFYKEKPEIHRYLKVLRRDLIACFEIESKSGPSTRQKNASQGSLRVGTKSQPFLVLPYSLNSQSPSDNNGIGFIEFIHRMDLDKIERAIQIRYEDSIAAKIKEEHKFDILDEFERLFKNYHGAVNLDITLIKKLIALDGHNLVKKVNALYAFYDLFPFGKRHIWLHLKTLYFFLGYSGSLFEPDEQGYIFSMAPCLVEVLNAIDIRITKENVESLTIEGAIAGIFRKYQYGVDINKMVPKEIALELNAFYDELLKELISSPLKIEELVSVYKKHELIFYQLIGELLSPIKQNFKDQTDKFTSDKKDYFDKLVYAYMEMCFQEVAANILEDSNVLEHENSVKLKEIISNIVSIMQISKEQEIDSVCMMIKILECEDKLPIDIKDHSDTEEEFSSIGRSSEASAEIEHSSKDYSSVSSVSTPVSSNGANSSYPVSSVSAPVKSEYVRVRPHNEHHQSSETPRRRIGADKSPSSFSSGFTSFLSGPGSSRSSILPSLSSNPLSSRLSALPSFFHSSLDDSSSSDTTSSSSNTPSNHQKGGNFK